MRFKFLMLLVLATVVPALAQNATVIGSVVDASTGAPVSGATVILRDQGLSATSGPAGDFRIGGAKAGADFLQVLAYGFNDDERSLILVDGQTVDAGRISMTNSLNPEFYEEQADLLFDESALEDEEGASQSVSALTGASDNIYYNASNYSFSTMYFRFRGYDSQYQTTYINGFRMNDPIRGRFNYSSLGGMTSRAFRNRTNTIGLQASSVGLGGLGGSSSISTITSDYSPGFNGSVAYTNSNYIITVR